MFNVMSLYWDRYKEKKSFANFNILNKIFISMYFLIEFASNIKHVQLKINRQGFQGFYYTGIIYHSIIYLYLYKSKKRNQCYNDSGTDLYFTLCRKGWYLNNDKKARCCHNFLSDCYERRVTQLRPSQYQTLKSVKYGAMESVKI